MQTIFISLDCLFCDSNRLNVLVYIPYLQSRFILVSTKLFKGNLGLLTGYLILLGCYILGELFLEALYIEFRGLIKEQLIHAFQGVVLL